MSVAHILVGNDNPLNVEFNDVVVDGTLVAPGFSPSPTVLDVASTVSGPWASPQSSFYHISYFGTIGVTPLQVSIQFDAVDAIASSATYMTISPNIPSQFLGGITNYASAITCFDNGMYLTGACIYSLDNVGQQFVESPGANNFSGVGTTGFDQFTISYIVPGP